MAILLGLAAAPARALEAPVLDSDSEVATAGYYQLSWHSDTTLPEYELQESAKADFSSPVVLYRGPDTATVITGRADGDYHYRLRARTEAATSPWSATVEVSVRHHSLGRALLFFSIGALVFVTTVFTILIGNRRNATRE